MKKSLINWLGLLGVISLLSYTAAVFFSPLAYPGYDWLSQAVSDLSASNAPSRILWNQLSCLYNVGSIMCIMYVVIFIRQKLTKPLRIGIYLWAAMSWCSCIGYGMFPLSESGFGGTFQDVMHAVTTVFVVGLGIAALVVTMIGGFRDKRYISLAIWSGITLVIMMIGPIGMGAAPKELFGLFERFSVFAATGYTAVLGIYLFLGFPASRSKPNSPEDTAEKI